MWRCPPVGVSILAAGEHLEYQRCLELETDELVRFAWIWILVLLWQPMAAQAAAFSLTWDAPDDCPSAEQVRAAVFESLDSAAQSSDAPTLFASAKVTRNGASYALDLSVTTPSGTSRKRMTAAQCHALVDAIALEISLAAPPDPAPAQSPVARAADARDEPERAQPPALVFGGRLMAGAGSGPVPWFAPTFGLATAVQWAALRFELGAAYGPAVSKRYAAHGGVGAEFESLGGSARACYVLAPPSVELPMCLGGEYGVITAAGFGVDAPLTARRGWGSLLLVQGVRWPSRAPIAAWGELSAAMALTRPSFRMRNLEPLHQVPAFLFRAGLGVELQID